MRREVNKRAGKKSVKSTDGGRKEGEAEGRKTTRR